MREILFIAVIFTGISVGSDGLAAPVTLRYALVVGNNAGTDPSDASSGTSSSAAPRARLEHAEDEARVMRDALIRLAHFDSAPERTRLVTGMRPADVTAAFKALAEQKARDEQAFGVVESFLFFYYSGHGADGHLLLRDGPLSTQVLGDLFNAFDATFSIALFDACFSGSLDRPGVSSKGIQVDRQAHRAFRELPKQVLNAKGSIWFVSSGAAEESFEDKRIGSIFTHFFLEAMEKAEPAGPGISIDRIWEYAQVRTAAYAAEKQIPQSPRRIISKLYSGAPIYFSFPFVRSSTLSLSADLEGAFYLSYLEGGHTEIIRKKHGETASYAVYPGKAYLIPSSNVTRKQFVEFKPEATLALSDVDTPMLPPSLGERKIELAMIRKGAGAENLVVTTLSPGPSLSAGAGYAIELAHRKLLQTRHGVVVPIRFDHDHVVITLEGRFGYNRKQFPSWECRIWKLGAALSGGMALNVGRARFDAGLGFGLYRLWQHFDNEEAQTGLQYGPTVTLGLIVPNRRRLFSRLFVDAGVISSPGIGMNAPNLWQGTLSIGLSLSYRVY